jgi:hypothetical protein
LKILLSEIKRETALSGSSRQLKNNNDRDNLTIMKTKHQPDRHSHESGNPLIMETNQSLTYNLQHKTYNLISLGLSSTVQLSSAVRALHYKSGTKANAHNLHRAFHFNPAAIEHLKFY